MYQFRREDMAFEAARLLAVYETQPIVVMARGLMNFFTIGPINNAVVQEAGRHMAGLSFRACRPHGSSFPFLLSQMGRSTSAKLGAAMKCALSRKTR